MTNSIRLSDKKCAVAIVNYNTADLVIAGLPALIDELSRLGQAQIFIVDNNSPNGDAEKLSTYLKQSPELATLVSLIASPSNGGFAAGNNIAFHAIDDLDWTPDFVWLLNPDTIVRSGALAGMAEVLCAQSKAGFVGARLENADGTTWSPAFQFPTPVSELASAAGVGFLQRLAPVLADVDDEATRVDWVGGASVLLREEARNQLGDMDEGYFLYFEEVDYMRRGIEAGWETWTAPQATVLHIAGSATGLGGGAPKHGPMPDYWFQSWARYYAKNHGPFIARLAALLAASGAILRRAHRAARGRPSGLPERYGRDFLNKVFFARLSPIPDARV